MNARTFSAKPETPHRSNASSSSSARSRRSPSSTPYFNGKQHFIG